MSIIAGIFARNQSTEIPKSLSENLRKSISRYPDERLIEYKFKRCLLVKVDVGAYQVPAVLQDQDGVVSLLAGDPLLNITGRNLNRTRLEDLEVIHKDLRNSDWTSLKKARESFCAVQYDPYIHQITLIADKIALRPMYYWLDAEYLIFATAIRIFEALKAIPKTLNLRGFSEFVSFGAPFLDRTPYAGISALQDAEIISFSNESYSTVRYWSWDCSKEDNRPIDELAEDGYKLFETAISYRLREDKKTIAFLSGGLDSRCIVSIIRKLNANVHSFNFSVAGGQDQIFAAKFAAAARVATHEEHPLPPGTAYPDLSTLMAKALNNSRNVKVSVEHPQLVWNGFGGSFTVGFVHMHPEVIHLLRAGNVKAAINLYLEKRSIGWPVRVLRYPYNNYFHNFPQRSLEEALQKFHCVDAGRNLYLCHLLREERSLLLSHFENIDLIRLEYHLPFCDADLLNFMLKVPVNFCFHHRFYLEIIKYFPSFTISVPWQTYPGHIPCPLHMEGNLPDQWSHSSREGKDNVYRLGDDRVRKVLKEKYFPDKVVNKFLFQIIALIHKSRLGNYDYIFDNVLTLQRFLKVCDGRIDL